MDCVEHLATEGGMDGATRGFGAMCSGEAQGLLDRRQMPRSSIVWKWDFAKVSLSGCILCALERIGAQVVGMKCCTPCLTVGQLKLGIVIVGNSTRWRPNLSSAKAMVSRRSGLCTGRGRSIGGVQKRGSRS